ncbi:hypothetical protein H5S09_02225 [Limosilactobacillus sp. STM2_1]|uniref:Uncharacterized protein n=1 Tax=Limosilactobacillus rudii TaxID=2759755 RepID=A0A7W3UJR2_9LACO|nr:hypothetical protein [Limosilactobacillus rudii]MBB1078658.1 hypothetical protein [Limosilactobacillus rudii]MBB1096774.1 hypothetical protein [Limosilactobacillus rudii]MCD7135554.1 hypothetical protein [Limosilactobacillus rudii]
MNNIKYLKRWKLMLTVIMVKLLTAKATFASMGSTGGGGTSTGGGITSTGGGSSSSSNSELNSSGGNDIIGLFILYFLLAPSFDYLIIIFVISYFKKLVIKIKNKRDIVQIKKLKAWMLTPNMTISKFKQDLRKHSIKLVNEKDNPLNQELLHTYAIAQFTYGQSIRQCLTKNSKYLAVLQQHLGHVFLSTMNKEIKLKARTGIIDDVIVNDGNILSCAKITGNLIIAKVQAIGHDDEVNIFSNFDSSFKRQQWTDYVIFGRKDSSSNWKIYNIIYGEHFHLNGTDYNKQTGLDTAGFEEKRLEISDSLIESAKKYRKNHRRLLLCSFVISYIIILLLDYELFKNWHLF